MSKMSITQADNFLDKDWVKDFFNQNALNIFGEQQKVIVNQIKRSKNLNPTSYNILYDLMVGGEQLFVRASTSTKYDVDYSFKTMELLYNHGFNTGDIQVPRPYVFFDEFNLMFYKDVPGEIFKKSLNDDIAVLIKKVKMSALALKKIHSVEKLDYHVWDHDWGYNNEKIIANFKELGAKLPVMRKELLDIVRADSKPCLCHGDFQPDNIVFNEDKLYVIDFGSVTLADRELDIASFIIKIKTMLPVNGDSSNFESLKAEFLNSYGDFDKQKFKAYTALYSLRILNSFLEFPDYENNKEQTPDGYQNVAESLKALDISVSG